MVDKKIIGVVSGKGGVGKSTIAVNISSLLSLKGLSTVLVDADFYNPCIGLHLGMWHHPVGFQHFLEQKAKLDEVLAIYPPAGLHCILSSLSYYKDIKTDNMSALINQLQYDYVVLDCSPGLSKYVEDIIGVCNELYIVITPDVPSVTSASKLLGIIEDMKNKPKISFILNRVTGKKYEMYPREIEHLCGARLSATIPEDHNIPESIASKMPVVLYNPNAKSSRIFSDVIEYSLPLAETRSRLGFFESIGKFFESLLPFRFR